MQVKLPEPFTFDFVPVSVDGTEVLHFPLS